MKHHTIVPIILVLREYNEDFIKLANKAGISDCVTVEYGHSEILMRTIWSLQKNEMRETHKKTTRLLEQLKVLDPKTGFYTTKQSKRVFANEISYLQDNKLDAVLMAITPNENAGIKITKEKLDEVVKGNVRGSDIVIMHTDNIYFLILTNTNLSGAMIVWSRIIKTIGAEGTICGCITDIATNPIDDFAKLMEDALKVALTAPNNFIAINNDKEDEDVWLESKGDKSSHNLKLFQQIFKKKMASTIRPIFEFAKKSAKRKLQKISFDINETPSSIELTLTKDDKVSKLKIEHTGTSYLTVHFIHEGLDSPENKKANMEFNEITEPKIKDIIDTFIVEYLGYANK